MNPVFSGVIKEGKVILDNPNRYAVQKARLEGKRIDTVLREHKSQRSNPQNAAYWGIAVEILADHLGYSKEETHDALRLKFLSRIDEKTGLTVTRSTTSLNTKEFSEYYDKIQRWAMEFLNCYIPSPNEAEY